MQEAEIEEDAEATRAVDWDKAAADAAYRAQVERAQERQRILQEQLAREVRPHCALSAISTDYRAYDGLGITWVLLVQSRKWGSLYVCSFPLGINTVPLSDDLWAGC